MTELLPTSLHPSSFLGQIGFRARQASRALNVDLGPAGACPDSPVLFIGDFDNSGSVVGPFGNDPVGNRFAECAYAIDAVSRRCRCGDELVALLSFDSPTSADVPPTALRSSMSAVRDGLRIPPDGGGSSALGPSLDLAYKLANQHPDHDAVLVVLSDFELLDGSVASALEKFVSFPGMVHAVVLRAAPPNQLVVDPRVCVTHVPYGSSPGAVAKSVFAALTATRPKRRANKGAKR